MKIKKMTRQEALVAKKKEYYTGEPCLRGHRDFRATLNGRCKECNREDARAKYKRMVAELASKNND